MGGNNSKITLDEVLRQPPMEPTPNSQRLIQITANLLLMESAASSPTEIKSLSPSPPKTPTSTKNRKCDQSANNSELSNS